MLPHGYTCKGGAKGRETDKMFLSKLPIFLYSRIWKRTKECEFHLNERGRYACATASWCHFHQQFSSRDAWQWLLSKTKSHSYVPRAQFSWIPTFTWHIKGVWQRVPCSQSPREHGTLETWNVKTIDTPPKNQMMMKRYNFLHWAFAKPLITIPWIHPSIIFCLSGVGSRPPVTIPCGMMALVWPTLSASCFFWFALGWHLAMPCLWLGSGKQWPAQVPSFHMVCGLNEYVRCGQQWFAVLDYICNPSHRLLGLPRGLVSVGCVRKTSKGRNPGGILIRYPY